MAAAHDVVMTQNVMARFAVSTTVTRPDAGTEARDRGVPVVDVVVPVYNEEKDIERSVRRLHAHLTATFPYPFRVTVADNASTDHTYAIAH